VSTPAEQLLNQLEAKKALSSQPMSDAERMLSELEVKSGRPDAQESGFRKDFVDPIARGSPVRQTLSIRLVLLLQAR